MKIEVLAQGVRYPDFNYGEFAIIASQAGLNSYKKSERKTLGWDIRRNLAKLNYRIHTDAIRDQANGDQLVCLSNLENLNTLFIAQDLPQPERLVRLNQIAIHHVTGDHHVKISLPDPAVS